MQSFDLNVFAIIILLSLLIVIYLVKDTVNTKSRLFRLMILTTILMNVLEILSWVFNEKPGDFNWFMNYTFNFFFTALGTVVVGLWACYIDYHVFKDLKQILRKWYYFLPTIIMLLLSIINSFYPILFTVNSMNEYVRLPLIWISIPLTIAVYIYVLLLVIKSKKTDNRKVIIGVIVFLSFPIIAAVFQMLFLGKTLIWPSTALAILISYLIFETTANSKDYLTKIFTRERAEEVIDNYLLKKKHFAVIMLDLDNFKKINDTKGHHIGDKFLVETANILSRVFEKKSTVSRYGGDEFIIVTEIFDESILNEKRKEVNRAVKESELSVINDLKLSFGIFICNTPDIYTTEQVIILADNDMYRNKGLYKKK